MSKKIIQVTIQLVSWPSSSAISRLLCKESANFRKFAPLSVTVHRRTACAGNSLLSRMATAVVKLVQLCDWSKGMTAITNEYSFQFLQNHKQINKYKRGVPQSKVVPDEVQCHADKLLHRVWCPCIRGDGNVHGIAHEWFDVGKMWKCIWWRSVIIFVRCGGSGTFNSLWYLMNIGCELALKPIPFTRNQESKCSHTRFLQCPKSRKIRSARNTGET